MVALKPRAKPLTGEGSKGKKAKRGTIPQLVALKGSGSSTITVEQPMQTGPWTLQL